MTEQHESASSPKTASDVVARLERAYGSLSFLPIDPHLVTVALAEYVEALGIADNTDDAFGLLSDDEQPVLPPDFLAAFAQTTMDGGDYDIDFARVLASLYSDEELFEPYAVAPVPLVTLMISLLVGGTRVAYDNAHPDIARSLIDATNELSLSLAVQTPRFESGILSRRNAEFRQVPSVFTVFNEDEYTKVTSAMMLLHTFLLAGTHLTVPENYDTAENADATQTLLEEFSNFVLKDEDDSDDEGTLSDEEVARFLSGTLDVPAASEPDADSDGGSGFGVHPIDTSAHVVGSTTTSDPNLLSLIPDDVDEVPVVSIQVEGHPAVETAWDLMVAAQRVSHSGGIAPQFIEDNPAHPTVLLHVWADSDDVDTSPDSPQHPPCIIIPLCLSCHAEVCSVIEDDGWLVLTPHNSTGGIAINMPPEMFMRMELEAFRIASAALSD